ncbi:MAG: hypothetical protein KJ922_05720, partial [Nanoarchaeota archaeon]|nr:hypothetical protein [Nanoarchaeota archaeon]
RYLLIEPGDNMFDENELKVIKYLVEQELKDFQSKEEHVFRDQSLKFLEAEGRYEEVLKGMMDKL